MESSTEQQPQISEASYHQLSDDSPLAIGIASLETGRILYANRRLLEIFAVSLEEAVQRKVQSFYVDLQEREPFLQSLLANGRVTDFQVRLKKGDGSLFWVSMTANLCTFDGCRAIHMTCIDITERKATQEALRIQDRALAASLNAIAIADLDRRLTFVNSAFLRLWGYSQEEEVLGKPVNAFWKQPEKALEIAQILTSGKNWEGELTAQRKDGSLFETQLSAIVVLDENGQPNCMLATFIDITQRKQAEKALRESEERFRTLFEQAAVGVALLETKTGRYVRINQKYCDFLGYTVQEMLQRRFQDVTYPEDVHENEENNAGLIEGKITEFSIDKRYVRKDGGIVWGNLTASPLWHSAEHPQIYYHIAVVQDINGRILAEKALRDREEELNNIFGTIQDAIFVIDPQYRLVTYNQAFQDAILADSGREMQVGEYVLRAEYLEEFRQIWQKNYQRALAGERFSMDVNIQRSDGVHYIENVLSPLFDSEKNITGVLVVSCDFTQRKQIELELQNSRKIADTLAAGVAHELNTPLQVIIGYSESLLKEMGIHGVLSPQRSERQLNTINRNAWRSAEIIASLQHYIHPELEKISKINLNDLVLDTLNLMEHQLKAREYIELETELAPNLPLMECEQNKIILILVHLINNACDALPYGGRIKIETAFQDSPPRLVLRVADNGEGIPHELQARIFDPFFTTKPVGSGVGLGLSIVQSIVRAHGGKIDVESTREMGSVFTISLPLDGLEVPQKRGSASFHTGRYD